MICPTCGRPFNEGNSPNVYECTEQDEEACEAFAAGKRIGGKKCTRCQHAKLYLPTEPGEGWITCPYRNGEQILESGAPFSDAFPEFSDACVRFVEI